MQIAAGIVPVAILLASLLALDARSQRLRRPLEQIVPRRIAGAGLPDWRPG
jgi:hypothetical protein